MTTAENIVKTILNPVLEKDNTFKSLTVPVDFWEKFAKALPNYELDSKPLYALIYSLELDDPENVISKIPVISNSFIKELAEDYVLNGNSEIALHLIQNHNKAFGDEVSFLQTFQKVIKKVERKRIKEDLPQAQERLSFELSDNEMALVAKKKGREDLKAKMKSWDNEIANVTSEVPVIAMTPKASSRVISLAWAKYAVAACSVIVLGTWVYLGNFKVDEPKNDVVVTPDVNKKTEKDTLKDNKNILQPQILDKNIEEQKEAVANNKDKIKSITSEGSAIGFSNPKEKEPINIIYNDNSSLIFGLEKQLKKNPDPKYQEEYDRLLKYQNKYLYDGKTIVVYKKTLNKKQYVLTSSSGLSYFFDGINYYQIENTDKLLDLIVVKDATVKEELERILFDNE